MPAPTHEHVAGAGGEAVGGVGAVANEVKGLERRGAHSPIVGDGCLLVCPRRKRGFDDIGCGGLAADCVWGKSAVEDHLGSVFVEKGGHDVVFKLAGY